jgi:hypothetical protein
MFLRNVGLSPNYKELQCRKPYPSKSPPPELKIEHGHGLSKIHRFMGLEGILQIG